MQPTGAENCVPGKKESEVELQLQSLERAVEALKETYGELRRRLNPVLRDDPKDASETGVGITGSGCPLSIRLRQADTYIVELRASMVHVLERLEI